jgi:hypothetical protein
MVRSIAKRCVTVYPCAGSIATIPPAGMDRAAHLATSAPRMLDAGFVELRKLEYG